MLEICGRNHAMMSASPGASDASHEFDHETSDTNAPTKAQSTTLKDKACPYCGQKFTSSSLGRHLDQYVSKKKPDGLHDVEEIKKLRAGITRRSARGKKSEEQEQSDVINNSGSITPNRASSTPVSVFKKALWPAAGIPRDSSADNARPSISNPTAPSISILPPPASQAGMKRKYSVYIADALPDSSGETTRALELSLREVLDAINVATNKVEQAPEPFKFDIHTQTFPALCLALLPSPPTLWQAAPFQTPTSVSITVPGHESVAALRTVVSDMLDNWKWDALAHVQKTTQGSTNVGYEADRLSVETDDLKTKARLHLDTAYNVFISQPPDQQQHQWSIELLRAYDREKGKTKACEARTENLLQEIDRLQQQIDYLERCQWPREMALWPPEPVNIDNAVLKELKVLPLMGQSELRTGARIPSRHRWDYDSLIDKWRRRIQQDRHRRGQISTLGRSDGGESSGASPTMARNHYMNDTSHAESATNSNGNGRKRTLDAGEESLSRPKNVPTVQASRSASRTQTPAQGGVQIVSDIEDTFARFAPYLKQKDLQERSGT